MVLTAVHHCRPILPSNFSFQKVGEDSSFVYTYMCGKNLVVILFWVRFVITAFGDCRFDLFLFGMRKKRPVCMRQPQQKHEPDENNKR